MHSLKSMVRISADTSEVIDGDRRIGGECCEGKESHGDSGSTDDGGGDESEEGCGRGDTQDVGGHWEIHAGGSEGESSGCKINVTERENIAIGMIQ